MAADPEASGWAAVETLLLTVEVNLDAMTRVLGLTAKALRHLGEAGVVIGTEDALVADCAMLALRLRQLGQRMARAVDGAREG